LARVFAWSSAGNADFRFPKDDQAQEHESGKIVLKQSRPAAIRPLGGGKMPLTTERMDAIRSSKTMAGSPDADHDCDQHLAILRMVFAFPASVFS
jgi:hypothetical protein